MQSVLLHVSTALLLVFLVSAAGAQEDASTAPLREGEIITYENLDRLQPHLPPEIWKNRDFVFYEGMRLEIGPSFRDYGPPEVYQSATQAGAAPGQPGAAPGPEAGGPAAEAGRPGDDAQVIDAEVVDEGK